MRCSRENLANIKGRIAGETGVSFESAAVRPGARFVLAALALVLVLSSMGVYAAKRFTISREFLRAQEAGKPGVFKGEAVKNSEVKGEDAKESASKQAGKAPDQDGEASEKVGVSSDQVPEEGFVNGFRISAPFAYNENEYSVSRYAHKGIDFVAPKGTPVLAAASGTVRLSEYSPSYGYHVIIDHADGFSTLYAHMESLTAEAGQQVEAGDQIGTVGSTGMSTGPHLHLELRIDDEPVDPSDYWE